MKKIATSVKLSRLRVGEKPVMTIEYDLVADSGAVVDRGYTMCPLPVVGDVIESEEYQLADTLLRELVGAAMEDGS